MTIEQLDEVQKDLKNMTAEEMGQHIRDFSAAAMAALNDRREERGAADCAPFNEELTALAAEAADIEAKSQAVIERMASAEYVKRAEYHQLVVEGKNEEARAKLAELEEVQAAPAKIDERRAVIAERVKALETEKRAALRRTGEDFREACIVPIRASETGLALFLDEARAALNNLETQLGVTLYQPEMLTAGEKSSEWRTLNRLYGGRV